MLNRLFGNYLVNRGYLNPAQLDDLLETITEYKADPQTVILVNKFLPLSQIRIYTAVSDAGRIIYGSGTSPATVDR